MREARADIEFQSHDACWLQVHLKSLHSLSSVFSASTLFPADKKTSLKHPTIFSILITALHGEGVEDGGWECWWGKPDLIGSSHPPRPFWKRLFLNFIFEFNKHGNLNRLIRFCTTVPDYIIKIGSN